MQAIVSVHCFVPPDLSYPKDINDQIVKYLMIACYLPKKQSLLLPKIIIFISALHAFTLFLKPKPHIISNGRGDECQTRLGLNQGNRWKICLSPSFSYS